MKIEPKSFQQRISSPEALNLADNAWLEYSVGSKTEDEESFKDGFLLCWRLYVTNNMVK